MVFYFFPYLRKRGLVFCPQRVDPVDTGVSGPVYVFGWSNEKRPFMDYLTVANNYKSYLADTCWLVGGRLRVECRKIQAIHLFLQKIMPQYTNNGCTLSRPKNIIQSISPLSFRNWSLEWLKGKFLIKKVTYKKTTIYKLFEMCLLISAWI